MTTKSIIVWAVVPFSLCFNTLKAQDIAPMEIGSRAMCASPIVNDPKIIQEALLNTRIQHPGLIEAMQKLRLQKGEAVPQVGDQNVFWVSNFQNQSYDTVRAELKFIGTKSYIWVALSEWNNGHVRSIDVDAMANALEQSTGAASIDPTKGILSIDRQVYGDPPNINSSFEKGKGDGKTHFLVCDIKDGYPASNICYDGYFAKVDVENSGQASVSNRRDMVYIDSYPGIYYGDYHVWKALTAMAHEFQHLIHWNYDPNEIVFFNEGMSAYAQYLCGYELQSPAGYLANTNVALLGWEVAFDNYSRAALWTRYVAEQFGLVFLKNLTQNPSTGIPGFEMSLAQSGVFMTFEAAMMNFFTANWMGSGGQDPVYRYKGEMTLRPNLKRDYVNPDVQQKDTLVQQSAQYISFSAARNFRITFALSAGVAVRAIESGSTAPRIRDVSSGVEFTSPELGTTYSSIVFVVMNTQPVLPATYSYASYGEPLHFLAEEGYDSGTPHKFSQDYAAYLGFGNNATTLGMAVRFQPTVKGNILRKARMMVAFDPEFPTGTASSNYGMKFKFHVWRDQNGRPGSDIITPFLVSVNRNVNPFGSFIDIDLSAYEKSLTNLSGPVYVGFTEDDGYTIGTYLAVDNLVQDDYSYVYRGPDYDKAPRNTWQTMREVSAMQLSPGELNGFNLMIRAVLEYSDSSAAPPLTIGYLQNPLLSEDIDVVAVSSAELRLGSMSGTLSQTNSSSALRFNAIPGTSKAFIDTTQKLNGNGTVSVRVRAARKYGAIYVDTMVTLNARLLKQDESATISTPSGSFSVAFQPGTVSNATYVTAFDGSGNPQDGVLPGSATTKIFSLGPSAFTLNRSSSVRVSGLGLDGTMTLALRRDVKWLAVPSTVDPKTGDLTATITRLGVFSVMKKDNVDGQTDVIPTQFALYQNYPNPFNPSTNFEFQVSSFAFVSLKIFDVLGREVATLVNEARPTGVYTIRWDASTLPSGVYYYRFQAGAFVESKKMVLLK